MGRGINDYDEVSLSGVAGGALEEAFQVELKKVLANINDPNTLDGKCEISLKITLTPNAKCTAADVKISASSKVQPEMPIETTAFLGKQGVTLKLWEHNPEQMRIPMAEGTIKEAPQLTTIGGIK